MKKTRIISTIILSLMLFLMVRFVVTNIFVTISDVIDSFTASQPGVNVVEEYGEVSMMLISVYGIGMLAVMIVTVASFGFVALTSGICLIFSLKNRVSPLKPVRIINYVLDCGFGLVALTCIAKIILLVTGN